MENYKDVNRDSGIAAYEFGADFIRVKFKDNAVYLYTNLSAGNENIAKMEVLAQSGDGLNSYINKFVKKKYARKER